MNKQMKRFGLFIGSLAIFSMIFSITTMSTLVSQDKVTHRVVQVKEVVLLTDPQRINLLIDELLTPKSAQCFRQILKHESHLNPKARNPKSSAQGVGQLLASTYRNLGLRHSNDGLAQTVASLSYVGRKYGGKNATCAAWKHWQKHKWY
jgi:nucleotidyltransferase/DNA polymerase involved in DNA repair